MFPTVSGKNVRAVAPTAQYSTDEIFDLRGLSRDPHFRLDTARHDWRDASIAELGA
jgi:hypothetical protein